MAPIVHQEAVAVPLEPDLLTMVAGTATVFAASRQSADGSLLGRRSAAYYVANFGAVFAASRRKRVRRTGKR